MIRLQSEGVPAGARRTGMDIQFKDPHLQERQYYIPLDHAAVGIHGARRPTFLLSKVTYDMRPAPLIGEHSEYVFKDLLAMTDEEIEELVIEGVIE
jgi:benzylsuccinate CoA-transferase BbsF subunit